MQKETTRTRLAVPPESEPYLGYDRPTSGKKNGNGTILSILEPLSGYYCPIGVKGEDAESLVNAMSNYFTARGRVNTVTCDNGPAFISERFKSFLKRLGIRLKFTSVYNPQANLSERPHSGINKFLNLNSRKQLSREELIRWSWAHNSLPKRRTSHSPAAVVFGAYSYGQFCTELEQGVSMNELSEEHTKFANNQLAEEALNRTVHNKFEQFDGREIEQLEPGTCVRWKLKTKLRTIHKAGIVEADAGASVLIELADTGETRWVRKSQLEKLVS